MYSVEKRLKKPVFIFLCAILSLMSTAVLAQGYTAESFVPADFRLIEKVTGDLNNDGLEDVVLVIKKIDASNVVTHEYRGAEDLNRRGIIILFKQKNSYSIAMKNMNGFSSGFDDGGVYYPPELWFEISKNKLLINYAHGRYGFWKYTFEYQNNAFVLIGYDAAQHRGPIVQQEVSMNFLTSKKLTRDNVNKESGELDPVFIEKWESLPKANLLILDKIDDFDHVNLGG